MNINTVTQGRTKGGREKKKILPQSSKMCLMRGTEVYREAVKTNFISHKDVLFLARLSGQTLHTSIPHLNKLCYLPCPYFFISLSLFIRNVSDVTKKKKDTSVTRA